MDFKISFEMSISDDSLLDKINIYTEESYTNIDEVPTYILEEYLLESEDLENALDNVFIEQIKIEKKNMKKFVIDVETDWCGMSDRFRAVAEKRSDLEDLAESLAYDNFESYNGASLMAKDHGYDSEHMEQEDWDKLSEEVDATDYYSYFITTFTGTEEEWEEIGGEIYDTEY